MSASRGDVTFSFVSAAGPVVLVFSLALLATSGCCAGGADFLTLAVAGNGSTTPRWGETMEWSGRSLTASHPVRRSLGGPAFELYDETDLPVEVPAMAETIDNSTRQGCGTSVDTTYDLSALELGSYTVVHRRRNGTGDRLNCVGDCPWTTFDGDEALVMNLVLVP